MKAEWDERSVREEASECGVKALAFEVQIASSGQAGHIVEYQNAAGVADCFKFFGAPPVGAVHIRRAWAGCRDGAELLQALLPLLRLQTPPPSPIFICAAHAHADDAATNKLWSAISNNKLSVYFYLIKT